MKNILKLILIGACCFGYANFAVAAVGDTPALKQQELNNKLETFLKNNITTQSGQSCFDTCKSSYDNCIAATHDFGYCDSVKLQCETSCFSSQGGTKTIIDITPRE